MELSSPKQTNGNIKKDSRRTYTDLNDKQKLSCYLVFKCIYELKILVKIRPGHGMLSFFEDVSPLIQKVSSAQTN